MKKFRKPLKLLMVHILIKLRFGLLVNFQELRASKWHIDFIIHLVTIIKPRNYLEIGIYKAGLLNYLIDFIPEITAVDINPESARYIKKKSKVNLINMNSIDFWEINTKKFDMIFIDGNHSKEYVEKDFYGAMNSLNDEGILLIHDTYPKDKEATNPDRCDDGFLAVQKIGRVTVDFEIMTIPVHPGLTLIRKRKFQVPWLED